jgi:hypothetical protein
MLFWAPVFNKYHCYNTVFGTILYCIDQARALEACLYIFMAGKPYRVDVGTLLS